MTPRFFQRWKDMKTVTTLLREAESAARADGLARFGAEHVVLAALALPEGSARRAFDRVGADPDGFATALTEQHAQALRAVGIRADAVTVDQHPPATPQTTRPLPAEESMRVLLRQMAAQAKDDRTPLCGAHIVRAAATLQHGTAPRVLQHMGIDVAELAAAATREIESRQDLRRR